jgi:uncharacterized membrane protein
MALGPIEVLVIGFPGNQFNGDIIPELERLIEAGTISVIDGLLVVKDENGDVELVEFEQIGAGADAARLANLLNQVDSLVSDEDIDELTANLEPNSSAAVLVFEHTWSKSFRDAIVDSGGELVADLRLPGAVVDELLDELAKI